MTDPTDNTTFIQAAHVSAGTNLPIDRIVIHGTVSLAMLGGALQVASYFTDPASGGSAQYVSDPGEIVQCVRESEISWNAPPNPHTIGWEFCDMVDWDPHYPNGFASQEEWNKRWDLPLWDDMLRLGASAVRAKCLQYNVPMVRLGPAQLLAGQRGICSHLDVSQAWHQTDHHDPGTTFPWARFMALVTDTAPTPAPSSAPTPPPAPPTGDDMLGYLARRLSNGQVVFITAAGVRPVRDMGHLNNLTALNFGYGPGQAKPGGSTGWYAMADGPFQSLIDSFGGILP